MIGKNDDAWEKLFYKYDILKMLESNNVFEISAEMIKEFREPRLMTKFDYSKNRPQIFRDNKLSILPNSRGTYNIGKFNAYKKLEYEDIKPISVAKPDWVRSFDDFPVTSESVALNLAQMTGMIDHVMGRKEDEESAVGTLTGRMKSGDFSYNIDFIGGKVAPYNFSVNNSQVEIDAGYESMTKLAVIEAKNRIPEDFMIRQLYYPYIGYDRLNTGKEVLPIYFTHADNIYGFHIFEFTDKKITAVLRRLNKLILLLMNNWILVYLK